MRWDEIYLRGWTAAAFQRQKNILYNISSFSCHCFWRRLFSEDQRSRSQQLQLWKCETETTGHALPLMCVCLGNWHFCTLPKSCKQVLKFEDRILRGSRSKICCSSTQEICLAFEKNRPGLRMRWWSCHQPCLLLRQPLAGPALPAVPLASGHLERFVSPLLCLLQGHSDRHCSIRIWGSSLLPPRPMTSPSSPPLTSNLSWAAPFEAVGFLGSAFEAEEFLRSSFEVEDFVGEAFLVFWALDLLRKCLPSDLISFSCSGLGDLALAGL